VVQNSEPPEYNREHDRTGEAQPSRRVNRSKSAIRTFTETSRA